MEARKFNPGEWQPVTMTGKVFPTPMDKDPSGKDLKQPGTKGDLGKSPVLQGAFQYFPRALDAVAKVSEFGANKYSWKGWEQVPDGINRYGNALCRHILQETIQGEYDRETGMLHAAQEAWNALARLELILREGKHALYRSEV